MKIWFAALSFTCVGLLAGCDKIAKVAGLHKNVESTETAAAVKPTAAQSTPATPTSVALSAAEVEQRQALKNLVPSGGILAGLITEGQLAFLAYGNPPDAGGGLTVEFLKTDGNAAPKIVFSVSDKKFYESLSVANPQARFDTETETANKEVVSQFYAAFSRRDVATVAGLLAANYDDHMDPNSAPGGATLLGSLRDPSTPPTTMGTVYMVAQGDFVASQVTVSSGNPPAYSPGVDVFRLKGGKLIDRWRINY